MNRREIGNRWENMVCEYLEKQGLAIIDRNFTVRGGEIDIIAREGDCICFIEVKYRSYKAIDAYFSVGNKKQRLIIKTAQTYLLKHPVDLQPRFDVVFVFSEGEDESIEYIRNAYDGTGR